MISQDRLDHRYKGVDCVENNDSGHSSLKTVSLTIYKFLFFLTTINTETLLYMFVFNKIRHTLLPVRYAGSTTVSVKRQR